MVVDTFIQRPILASVCSLVIILAGAIAIPTLPIAQFPELAPPTVSVNAFYQGASAEIVESAVTQPIEQALNGVEGMQYITSSSGSNGSATVTVTFDVDRDIDVAAVDVQNRISQVEGRLPNEVKAVGISVTKSSQNFVLVAGVYAENNQYDPLFSVCQPKFDREPKFAHYDPVIPMGEPKLPSLEELPGITINRLDRDRKSVV